MNKTTDCGRYFRTEMEVKSENLSKVLAELESNEKVWGIDLHYLDVNGPKTIVRFCSDK